MRKNVILTVIALMMSLSSVMAQDKVYQLSSHILDINTGRPAQGVKIVLSLKSASNLNGNLNCSKELEHYAS